MDGERRDAATSPDVGLHINRMVFAVVAGTQPTARRGNGGRPGCTTIMTDRRSTAAGLANVVRAVLGAKWTADERKRVVDALEAALDQDQRRRVRERPHARSGDPPEGK